VEREDFGSCLLPLLGDEERRRSAPILCVGGGDGRAPDLFDGRFVRLKQSRLFELRSSHSMLITPLFRRVAHVEVPNRFLSLIRDALVDLIGQILQDSLADDRVHWFAQVSRHDDKI